MDFSKMLAQGRKTALKPKKDTVLITFQAERELRDKANRKGVNVSDFLRRCLERLVQSDIDKKTKKLYDEIIKEEISSCATINDI